MPRGNRRLVQTAIADSGMTIATTAEQTARCITRPDRQAEVLARVAGGLALAGHYERAEQNASCITRPDRQAEALARVAGALAQAGHYERAGEVATTAEQTARCITRPDRQAE